MANNLRRSMMILACAAAVACLATAGFAQNREKFVISAKAGGINAVTGRAKVHLKGGADWQVLSVTDDLEAGDMVRTEMGARVEMLLNPGSYLRLGENSEFELVNNNLDNVEVRLLRGTAIVEATGADDTELLINITTPHTKMAIVRHGLYRLNVVPEDATELIVRKGRVMLNDSHTKIKGGNKVIISANNQPMVAKLQGDEKKDRDLTDNWSKERAETLAKANRRITNRMLVSAFNTYTSSDWMFTSLFSARSTGFWIFNRGLNCFTFLPFYNRWGSPYGSSYSNAIYNPYWGTTSWGSTFSNPTPNVVPGAGSVDRVTASPSPRIRDEYPAGRFPKPDSGRVDTGAPIRPSVDMSSPARNLGKPDLRPDVTPRPQQ